MNEAELKVLVEAELKRQIENAKREYPIYKAKREKEKADSWSNYPSISTSVSS